MKTALLMPRVNNTDLTHNDNLLSSKLVSIINLCNKLQEQLEIDTLVLDETKPYDIIISAWAGTDLEPIKLANPGVTIYEFHYDGLNGGWFLDRYTIDNETVDNSREANNVNGIPYFTRLSWSENTNL